MAHTKYDKTGFGIEVYQRTLCVFQCMYNDKKVMLVGVYVIFYK